MLKIYLKMRGKVLCHLSYLYEHLNFCAWGAISSIESPKVFVHSITLKKTQNMHLFYIQKYSHLSIKMIARNHFSTVTEETLEKLFSQSGSMWCPRELTHKAKAFNWKFEEKQFYLMQHFSMETSLSSDPVVSKQICWNFLEKFSRRQTPGVQIASVQFQFGQVTRLKTEF